MQLCCFCIFCNCNQSRCEKYLKQRLDFSKAYSQGKKKAINNYPSSKFFLKTICDNWYFRIPSKNSTFSGLGNLIQDTLEEPEFYFNNWFKKQWTDSSSNFDYIICFPKCLIHLNLSVTFYKHGGLPNVTEPPST